MIDPCETLRHSLGKLFECEPFKNLIRIKTPFEYPDGGSIDLFLENDGSYISDMGETIRWLGDHSFSAQRTQKQISVITRICKNSRVLFERGKIMARVGESGSLSDSLIKVSQCCMRVSDVSFTFQGKTSQSTTDDVAKYLSDNEIPFERNPSFDGISGRKVILDFKLLVREPTPLIKVLFTTSKAQKNRIVNTALRNWVELERIKKKHRFIALFDDTVGDVWNAGDSKVLERHSDVFHWSHREELIQKIVA